MNLSASWSRLRDGLPDGSEAELRLRGDEVFGRRITISYLRDQTDEEAEFDRRYSEATREAKERELRAAAARARRRLLLRTGQARDASNRRLNDQAARKFQRQPVHAISQPASVSDRH